jgi:hypothetical protein
MFLNTLLGGKKFKTFPMMGKPGTTLMFDFFFFDQAMVT